MIDRERWKEILVTNSVHSRPGKENSEKNSKNENFNSGIISIQNGLREAKKERKKFESQIPFLPEPGKKIQKTIVKKFKKLKNLFLALFLAKTG